MLTRKEFHEFIAPKIKDVHNSVNAYLVTGKYIPKPGHVATHVKPEPRAGKIEWEGLEITIDSVRRPSVVCNVPTPFSLYAFSYCAHFEGKRVAYGQTMPDFISNVFRFLRSQGKAR